MKFGVNFIEDDVFVYVIWIDFICGMENFVSSRYVVFYFFVLFLLKDFGIYEYV